MDWADLYRRLEGNRDDPEAWSALEDRVRRLTRGALADRPWHVIEDVVADTCSSVILNFGNARRAETFDGFVLGCFLNARRRGLSFYDTPTVPIDVTDPPAPPDDGDDGEVGGDSGDERAILERCLAELPERERRAVELRYFARASGSMIAARLGVAEGNARRIVFNGVARLRRCVRRFWPFARNADGSTDLQ